MDTKLCTHCDVKEPVKDQTMCGECLVLPRCEVCTVIFGGLVNPSKQNVDRCDGCLNFELLIKFNCFICEEKIPIYISKNSKVLHYIVRGNACSGCNGDAKGKPRAKEERNHQFIGYLAILKNLYDAGKIGKGSWEHAIRMNPHDVVYWDGLEELKNIVEDDTSEEIEEELKEETE